MFEIVTRTWVILSSDTRNATLGQTVHLYQAAHAVAMVTGVGGTPVNWRGNSEQVMHLLLDSGKPHTGDIYFRSSVAVGSASVSLSSRSASVSVCLCVSVCVLQSRHPVEPRLHSSNASCFLFLFFVVQSCQTQITSILFLPLLVYCCCFFYLFHAHKRTYDHVKLAFPIVNIIKET